MQSTLAFVLGLLFALGLGVSGMTKPSKVIGFLDVAGAWDPSLLFVMVGAIAVYGTAYRRVIRRDRPLGAPKFAIPTKTAIDARLAAGAVIFGAGWGLGGFCPGPSLVAMASGMADAGIFVAAMVAGMLAHTLLGRLGARPSQENPVTQPAEAGSLGGVHAD